MRRTFGWVSGVVLGLLMLAVPASAQVVQSVQFGGGLFAPRGFDSRVIGDVLVADLIDKGTYPGTSDALLFDIKDFRSGHVFGEWNITFGDRVEVGASVGFYTRTVPSIYDELVNRSNSGATSEIEQDLRLRIVPVMGTVRFMPFGRAGGTQPYLGAAVGLLRFRYSEIGQFVDPTTGGVFDDRYIVNGSAPGGAFLGGVKLPLGGDVYGMNLEYRYQFGTGKTGGVTNGFLDEKIDLSGAQFNVAFQIRF